MIRTETYERSVICMTMATVGERYQVVIPKAERKRLGLKPRSKVNVEVRDGCLILHPLTAEGIRGLGKDLADGSDPADYVRKLRAEWGERQ